MTHTKHRKRRERADREEAERLAASLPGFAELQRALAAPLSPRDDYWSTTGRTGRAG